MFAIPVGTRIAATRVEHIGMLDGLSEAGGACCRAVHIVGVARLVQAVIFEAVRFPVPQRYQRVFASPLVVGRAYVFIVELGTFLHNRQLVGVARTGLGEAEGQVAPVVVNHFPVYPAQVALHHAVFVVLVEKVGQRMYHCIDGSFGHPDVPAPHDAVLRIAHRQYGVGLLHVVGVDGKDKVLFVIA